MRLVAPLVVDYSTSCRLVVDYFASTARPGALARRAARHAACRATRRRLLRLAQARHRLLRLRRASGCLGTSRDSSRGSSRRSSSTTSPPPHVRVPRHVTRLVMRLVAPLVVNYSASRRLVVDYFTYTAHPGASARRAARHVSCRSARRRLLRLAQAHRRLLRLRCASGCLDTSCGSSRGSSRRSSSTTLPRTGSSSTTPPRAGSSSATSPRAGSSSTTSPAPRVRVPRHIARLVSPLAVNYFAYAARPGASARCAARHTALRRLLRAPRLCLAATLALLQPRRAS
jgi:hypothetical protein